MKKKMNNKGFSLVELIIVIAIMAVLIGVLAPQYIKFVAKSKVSTDITNAEELANAINVALADTDMAISIASGTPFSAGTVVTTEGGADKVKAPASKVNSTRQWVVTYDTNGVSAITLGGTAIWPDASAYN